MAELDLADEFGNGVVRITSRQDLQLYGVAKRNLAAVLRRINQAGLTTLAAAGDMLRNVMCCPAPSCRDPVHGQIEGMAGHLCPGVASPHARLRGNLARQPPGVQAILITAITAAVAVARAGRVGWAAGRPRGRAALWPHLSAAEIQAGRWFGGRQLVDLYANDLGLMAVCEDFQVVVTTFWWVGGWACPRRENTFPAVARPMARVRPEQVLEVIRAVVTVLRDPALGLTAARLAA